MTVVIRVTSRPARLSDWGLAQTGCHCFPRQDNRTLPGEIIYVLLELNQNKTDYGGLRPLLWLLCSLYLNLGEKLQSANRGSSAMDIPLRLQEFPRASPSGTPSVGGVYLTVYPSSRPNTDTVYHYKRWNTEIELFQYYLQARNIFHTTLPRQCKDYFSIRLMG